MVMTQLPKRQLELPVLVDLGATKSAAPSSTPPLRGTPPCPHEPNTPVGASARDQLIFRAMAESYFRK